MYRFWYHFSQNKNPINTSSERQYHQFQAQNAETRMFLDRQREHQRLVDQRQSSNYGTSSIPLKFNDPCDNFLTTFTIERPWIPKEHLQRVLMVSYIIGLTVSSTMLGIGVSKDYMALTVIGSISLALTLFAIPSLAAMACYVACSPNPEERSSLNTSIA